MPDESRSQRIFDPATLMKFRFIWIGRTREQNYKALQDEYLKRLSHFVKTDIVELRDGDRKDRIEAEGEAILAKLLPGEYVCVLDPKGLQFTSHGIASMIENWQTRSIGNIAFVIGGADGISSRVAERADRVLSLSILTFTHEMARVVMLEQLYRAFTIIKGYPYQK